MVHSYYKRIAVVEPIINAFSFLKEEYSVIDEINVLLRNQVNQCPLLGIPYGVKDLVQVEGLPLEAGSKILKGNIATKNATVINRLNRAGAALIGKTTTAEFASGGGAPSTKNPWNLSHTPGGSSSGSAASVASEMVMFALGTQTSGSVIRPASYSGVVALKPTFGQISKSGIIPASWSIDCIGIFTKNVKDLKYIYNEIAGFDIKDQYTYPYKNKVLHLTNGNLSKKFKIAVLTDDYFMATIDIMDNFQKVMEKLRDMGHEIISIKMPALFEKANAAHSVVVDSETAFYHSSYFNKKRELFSTELRTDIEEGLSYSAHDYLEAQEMRYEYQKEFVKIFSDIDLIITPATPETAPEGLKSTGSPKFNKPFSNAGLPVITIPIALSDKTNLPIAVQIISDFDCEQRLIDIGEQLQFYYKLPDYMPNLI
ncbi:hypothetical protein DOK78_001933 [Enterococcus sp. DIV2402]|uniref:Amidase domain-containing protein n=1 Tax=Candidatus Enterococcus lowellii TaxID=2230877 RepID=A0ABZ2SND1_9ENTE|nr:amidase [Enterococcus sp. DIV2402]MBO0463935.1 amidase [Enterococcus sp. DIV2402]